MSVTTHEIPTAVPSVADEQGAPSVQQSRPVWPLFFIGAAVLLTIGWALVLGSAVIVAVLRLIAD